MGDVVAQVLSFANTKDEPVKPPRIIVNNLTALRARVNRTVQARAMARYELSLQGEWPSDLYASLQALQMCVSFLFPPLSSSSSCLVLPVSALFLLRLFPLVTDSLSPPAGRSSTHSASSPPSFRNSMRNGRRRYFIAPNSRTLVSSKTCSPPSSSSPMPSVRPVILLTRLNLSSLLQLTSPSLSPSTDNATPLPFIYNPLLERFLKSPEAIAAGHGYGYDVALDNEEGVEGLPAHVDLKTICSLDYLRFSSGVSQAYAIVNRLDRLMVRSLLSLLPHIASPSQSPLFVLCADALFAVCRQITRRRELHHLRPRQEFALRLQSPRNRPEPRPLRHRVDEDELRPQGGDRIAGT
jgi:hypothetical protein